MAMEQIGYVAKIENGIVKIKVERESACGGNCAGCHGCPQNAVFVEAPNDPEKPFLIGEEVVVVMPTKSFFAGMLKSYGVMIFTMIFGALLGFFIFQKEVFSVIGGFSGLVFGGWLVHLLGKQTSSHITVLRKELDSKKVIDE